MAPRPKNPPPDRRQEILAAAFRLFAEKGYAATTNADIARAAGVTPPALYYYFPSKADLFKAAISDRKSAIFPEFSQMADQVLDSPPDVVLPMVIQAMVTFMADERTQALVRILLTEGPRHPEVVEIYESQGIGQVIPLLFRYLQHQMDLGRIPKMEPLAVAALLMGPIVATLIMRDLLQLGLAQRLTNEAMVRGIIERTLPGLLSPNKE